MKSGDSEIETLGPGNLKLREENQKLQEENGMLKDYIQQLSKQIESLDAERTDKSNNALSIDYNYIPEEGNKSGQKEELKKQEELIEALNKPKENLEQSLITLQNQKDSLAERLESKAKECEDKEKQYLELSAQLIDLKAYKDEIEELKKQISNAQAYKDEIEELKKQISNAQHISEDMKKTNQDLVSKNDLLAADVNTKTSEMAQLIIDKESSVQEISKAHEIIREKENVIDKFQEQIKQLERDIKALEESKAGMEYELVQLRAKLSSTEKLIAEKDEHIKNLEQSIDNNTKVRSEINNKVEEKEVESIEIIKKELEELKEFKELALKENTKKDGSSAAEHINKLQKQNELMVKENNDLRAALFVYENARKNPYSEETEVKISVIEEIRQLFEEVIYSYKTMNTNAKQWISNYGDKKSKANDFIEKKDKLIKAKSQEEFYELVNLYADSLTFLKTMNNMQTAINCLKEMGIHKLVKLRIYENEIAKHTLISEVSDSKVAEYEDRLTFYY